MRSAVHVESDRWQHVIRIHAYVQMLEPLRTHEECMLIEAQKWRASIRSPIGARCRDPKIGGRCYSDPNRTSHEPGCWWEYAVFRIYELERALGL